MAEQQSLDTLAQTSPSRIKKIAATVASPGIALLASTSSAAIAGFHLFGQIPLAYRDLEQMAILPSTGGMAGGLAATMTGSGIAGFLGYKLTNFLERKARSVYQKIGTLGCAGLLGGVLTLAASAYFVDRHPLMAIDPKAALKKYSATPLKFLEQQREKTAKQRHLLHHLVSPLPHPPSDPEHFQTWHQETYGYPPEKIEGVDPKNPLARDTVDGVIIKASRAIPQQVVSWSYLGLVAGKPLYYFRSQEGPRSCSAFHFAERTFLVNEGNDLDSRDTNKESNELGYLRFNFPGRVLRVHETGSQSLREDGWLKGTKSDHVVIQDVATNEHLFGSPLKSIVWPREIEHDEIGHFIYNAAAEGKPPLIVKINPDGSVRQFRRKDHPSSDFSHLLGSGTRLFLTYHGSYVLDKKRTD